MDTTTLGEMLVKYTADISDLTKNVKEVKSNLSSVADDAKKSSDSVTKSLKNEGDTAKKTGDGFSSMLKGALSMAAGFAMFTVAGNTIGFLKDQVSDVIQVTEQYQLTQAQTNQVLKSTHDVSGMTKSALDDLAESYGRTTMFSADTVQQGENLLLTFTNIGKKVFPQATQAILNVSQAMGQDLKSSAIQVGKALGDPLTGMSALQRIGVTFSAQEKQTVKDMMAHNNIIGAQTIILKELSTEFGGSATAAGKTFAGQMAILGNQFDEIKIKIGEGVMPILNELLNKYVVPLATKFSDWMLKGGGLQDFQKWIQTASSFLQEQLIPAFLSLLNDNIIPLAQEVGSLWQDAVNLFQAFQDGQPYAAAIATALASIGSAIALINLEEWGAGLANTFSQLSEGNGIIANMASQTLPNLGQALGWTTSAAEGTATAIDGIGAASLETEGVVVAAAATETLAMAAVTGGISLLIGATIAAIALALSKGQSAMTQATKQAYDSLGRSSDDMKAKAKADADVTDVSWKTTSSDVGSRWQSTGEQMAKSSANASAQMVIDQQKIADAAIAAAQKADDAWTKASQDANLVALMQQAGWTGPEIQKYLAGSGTDTSGVSAPHPLQGHASGIFNNPVGHMASLAEQGSEWMYIPNPTTGYVPQGASVLPHGTSPSGGSGGQTFILEVDSVQLAQIVNTSSDRLVRLKLGSRGRAA